MHLIKMPKIKRILCCNEENGRYPKKNHDDVFACNNYNVQTCSQLDEILISKLYNEGDKLQKIS